MQYEEKDGCLLSVKPQTVRLPPFLHVFRRISGLFRLALISDCLFPGFDGFLITQVIMPDRIHILVQLIDQGNTGGDIQTGNFFIADAVQKLHQCPQRIAVRCDQDMFPGF